MRITQCRLLLVAGRAQARAISPNGDPAFASAPRQYPAILHPGPTHPRSCSALPTVGDVTVDPTCNTTMTQCKVRRSAKKDSVAPNRYPIRTAGQTPKCRCRR
jgi:hypothetical protein